jgi:hypothetical protein
MFKKGPKDHAFVEMHRFFGSFFRMLNSCLLQKKDLKTVHPNKRLALLILTEL